MVRVNICQHIHRWHDIKEWKRFKCGTSNWSVSTVVNYLLLLVVLRMCWLCFPSVTIRGDIHVHMYYLLCSILVLVYMCLIECNFTLQNLFNYTRKSEHKLTYIYIMSYWWFLLHKQNGRHTWYSFTCLLKCLQSYCLTRPPGGLESTRY